MSKRNDKLLLEDIIESANKILSYTQGLTFEEFCSDDKTIDAVVRNFEIIGEAANRLTDSFKAKHSGIDWYKIRGFRNRIVHDYFGIDYSIVWRIKEDMLPSLTNQILNILSETD